MNMLKSYPVLSEEFNQLNLYILENGVFLGDQKWYFNDVISDFNRLYFIMEGEAYLETEEEKFVLRRGMAYLIPAGTQYTYRCTKFVKKFYLHFQMQVFPGWDIFEGLKGFLEIPYEEGMLDGFLKNLEESSIGQLLRAKLFLDEWIQSFYLLSEENRSDDEKFLQMGYYNQKPVLRYITERLSNNLTVAEIAEALKRPYYEVSRSFCRDIGIGIKEYIGRMLLKKAKYLLLATDKRISEIAEELKFCDAYYFSRFFKKYEKTSPKEYRRRHQKEIKEKKE